MDDKMKEQAQRIMDELERIPEGERESTIRDVLAMIAGVQLALSRKDPS